MRSTLLDLVWLLVTLLVYDLAEQTAPSVSEKYDAIKEVDADMATTYTNTQVMML